MHSPRTHKLSPPRKRGPTQRDGVGVGPRFRGGDEGINQSVNQASTNRSPTPGSVAM
jgi:hypothetical protein